MAASSPALSNNSNETGTTNGGTPPRRSALIDTPTPTPKQNLRGLNKPKCSTCGNVARSRCPYQSCKSCCAKAQNPCHIHVLKPNATLPDKQPPSNSPLFDQQSTDVPSTGASVRFSSLRQLSNNFAQFNRAHIPLRSRKPLSRKDAAAINAWRFSKLKEHNNSHIEAENEAFDRYMQNVSLLEEAFSVNLSLEGPTIDGPPALDSASSSEDESQKVCSGMKLKLKSNSERANSVRQRIRDLVDEGLRRLQKQEFDGDDEGSGNADDLNGQKGIKRPKHVGKWRAERTVAVNDLIDKLNKARNEDELKSCLEMKLQLFNDNDPDDLLNSEKAGSPESKDVQTPDEQNAENVSIPNQESDSIPSSSYLQRRLCSTIEINQEILSDIDVQFSSLAEL
ncbi:uncharacterized protein LOC143848678 [Tasmannia lanceolata]|uniref:uncharacterized protein LOC143848678 n=1 Tax=Tasmannia lanceolata TaxID=3420 RepID=UPI0040632342